MTETAAQDARPGHHQEQVTFTVDGERVTVNDPHQTPNEILQAAGVDPANHYLERVDDHHSYQGKGDEPIRVHDHEKFVSVYSGATPVS